jgi:hypothetical protein
VECDRRRDRRRADVRRRERDDPGELERRHDEQRCRKRMAKTRKAREARAFRIGSSCER